MTILNKKTETGRGREGMPHSEQGGSSFGAFMISLIANVLLYLYSINRGTPLINPAWIQTLHQFLSTLPVIGPYMPHVSLDLLAFIASFVIIWLVSSFVIDFLKGAFGGFGYLIALLLGAYLAGLIFGLWKLPFDFKLPSIR